MKAVILCGGLGTRLGGLTYSIPKPMLEIGDKPMLEHIMDIFISYGVYDFILSAGYKWNMIVGHFIGMEHARFSRKLDDITIDFPECRITVVNTGNAMTGGRILGVRHLLDDEPFFFTYGDGLANVNLDEVISLFNRTSAKGVVTAAHPLGRFGRLSIEGDLITSFGEKIESTQDWINGGFSLFSPGIIKHIHSSQENFEKDCMPEIIKHNPIHAYKHSGFWQCVDTERDLDEIRKVYTEKGAIWLKS